MFKMGTSTDYSWPVKVEIPVDGGKTEKSTFDARFKRFPQAKVESLGRDLADGRISEPALIEEILVGWKGVMDAEGTELPFSETNRDELMEIFPVRGQVILAWLDSLKAGRQKN